MSKFQFTKLNVFLLVACFLIVCLLPFPINDIVNAASYNPVKDYNSEYVCETLTESLYPEIYYSKLAAKRTSELNFGRYEVSYSLVEHTEGGFEYGYGVSTDYSCGKRTDKNFDVIPERYNIDGITAKGGDFSWSNVEDGACYFAYFKIVDTHLFDGAVNHIDFANEHFTAADGAQPVEWIGYSLQEKIFGVSVTDRNNFNLTKSPVNLFELFVVLGNNPKEIEFLSSLGLFGDLRDYDFKALAQENSSRKPDVIMMYGKGETLKEFAGKSEIKPLSFKNIETGKTIG